MLLEKHLERWTAGKAGPRATASQSSTGHCLAGEGLAGKGLPGNALPESDQRCGKLLVFKISESDI